MIESSSVGFRVQPVAGSDPAEVSRTFFQAYADGAREKAYMARVLDLQEAGGSAEITQIVGVDEERAMTMVEIHVSDRNGKSLHNHAAFLARVVDDEIAQLWMVEALPAYSDEFWS